MMEGTRVLRLPSRSLVLDRCLVMGILNRTTDSFYDQGAYRRLDAAMDRVRRMIADGADIVDIGAERAGPGRAVPEQEEIALVVETVERIRSESDVPLSVDTIKPEVARAAMTAGADIINSIGGMEAGMRKVAAQTGAAVVVMHIQGTPRVANPTPVYRDVVGEVRSFLERRARECIAESIAPDGIIIDPGPGFGKTAEHDRAIIRHLADFTALPYPVLLAASRKGFIGDVLGNSPSDRLPGSLAVAAWGVMQGVRIIRTHDVTATLQACRMTEAVMNAQP
ncbi:MAG TPA: dihydropteroate synthase [Chloroflexota bacterium]|nr:dihydropteroate synthase [Chloroflexota bacterium]